MNEIKICDALMGSGKTEGAIRYMNEHPEKKFIYITQYLPEAERIKRSCPNLHFVEPSSSLSAYQFCKTAHCAMLLREGRNITSTHQLFKLYTDEMLESIRTQGYTLIIDEAVDVFETAPVKPDDFQVLIRGGYLEKTDIGYHIVDDSYSDGELVDLFNMLKHNQIVEIQHKKKTSYYCWMMPKELLEAFDEVIVLTYMFHCQDFCYYMQLNDIPYRYIGVEVANGCYRLYDTPGYKPPYTARLREKIHILNVPRMGLAGKDRTALSENWLKNNPDKRNEVKANIYNYFVNRCRDIDKSRFMWGTYKSCQNLLKGKGYTNAYLVFNQKSSNEYRHKDHLAYCSNLFMRPEKRNWLVEQGVEVYEEDWAMSVMTQWVWRSAIRDGKEIWIYIPSKRMKKLFENWIEEVSGPQLTETTGSFLKEGDVA